MGLARLFEKHAKIVIADPGATARDVFELTEKMPASVTRADARRVGFGAPLKGLVADSGWR